MMFAFYIAVCLVPLASAHFELDYPAGRGTNTRNQATFPCGGYPVSNNRTEWPVAGGPVALSLGHAHSRVQVLLAMGNDPGSNFNVVLVPTIQEEGPGEFCLPNVQVPANLGVTDGQNATIQVITDSESSGGLYNCADITFRTSAPKPSSCTNGTGVTAMPVTGPAINANETKPKSSASASGTSSASASGTSSATASASSPVTQTTNAASLMGMEWGLGGVLVGALGVALLL